MQILPAIDLYQSKVVRLLQGSLDHVTVYADDAVAIAREFAEAGAEYLHVVDLDGAFQGESGNDQVIRKIVQAVGLKVEVGGGIRSIERIEELLNLGVDRVVLGTVAVREPELVAQAVKHFGERIIVGIDARDGWVAVQGWAEKTELKAEDLGKAMKAKGVERIIFTDISRDGMLQGPNVESIVRLAKETGLKVIASGGISSLADLWRLKQEKRRGAAVEGVIIGKALYSGAFTLAEALTVAQSRK